MSGQRGRSLGGASGEAGSGQGWRALGDPPARAEQRKGKSFRARKVSAIYFPTVGEQD